LAVFRYNCSGNWYKGNPHIHSIASDGTKDFGQLAAMYAEAGYDFLCRTDHWVASDVAADGGDYPLLWLDGVELNGSDTNGSQYHVVCLGRFEGIDPQMGFVPALEACRAQGGFLILAHPHWTGNTFEDALRWGFDGVERYNHVTQWSNGKGEGAAYWSAMLERNGNVLALAVDDAHLTAEEPGWNGGWIVVKADECSQEAILSAIRSGRFYSSCGPEFHCIEWQRDHVHVKTSPVSFVRLVGPAWRGKRFGSSGGPVFTEADFDVPDDWAYAYLEIEDGQGRRAWTNTLFVAQS